MKKRNVVLVSLAALALATASPAHARHETHPENHGQCVRSTPTPDGPGGRSAVARSQECRDARPDPGPGAETIDCTDAVENGNVEVDGHADEATITGTGPQTPGSSLECGTQYDVAAGDEIVFTYELGAGTAACGGGIPRVFVQIGGVYYNTFDGDSDCSEADGTTITYVIPVSGTVTNTGLVYDRGDTGSVTYSDVTVGGMALDL